MQGTKCISSRDDAHGAPIISRQRAQASPEEFVAEIVKVGTNTSAGFTSSSTTGTRRTRPKSGAVAGHLSPSEDAGLVYTKPSSISTTRLRAYLADRYIKASARTAAQGPYGDACENCSKVLSATDLKNPYSALTGVKPELRSSDHFFFTLSDPGCVAFLREWLASRGRLQPQVLNKALEWIDGEGDKALGDWDISRDAPYFGIPIPDAPAVLLCCGSTRRSATSRASRLLREEGLDFDAFLADPATEQFTSSQGHRYFQSSSGGDAPVCRLQDTTNVYSHGHLR